jgi:hypothetical protein
MLVGPINFSLAVSADENETDFVVATVTARRTDGKPLENPHIFVQPADLVMDHADGSVSVSLSREEIRQGLGHMAIRIKDRSGQPLADVTLVASIEKDGSMGAKLERRWV